MWLPNAVAALTNLGLFLWLFRDRIPECISPAPVATGSAPTFRTAPRWWQLVTGGSLAASLAGLVVLGVLERPLWWTSMAGAGVLLLAAALAGRVTVTQAFGDVSWSLGVFVIAMTMLVRAVELTWLADVHPALPASTWARVVAGVAAGTIGSNVINNVPMSILARSMLETLPAGERATAAWAVLVGTNIGPALTTYGSLATMLWLTLVRRNGIDVTTGGYLRVSLITVPIVLLTTSATLWLVLVL
jgi:arsenical pump membrane protein